MFRWIWSQIVPDHPADASRIYLVVCNSYCVKVWLVASYVLHRGVGPGMTLASNTTTIINTSKLSTVSKKQIQLTKINVSLYIYFNANISVHSPNVRIPRLSTRLMRLLLRFSVSSFCSVSRFSIRSIKFWCRYRHLPTHRSRCCCLRIADVLSISSQHY